MPIEVILPKLEMAQETATIIEWLKKEGDAVEKGEPLLMMETDKVTFELESPGSGNLAIVRGEVGVDIPVSTVIAYLLRAGEEVPEGEAVHAPLSGEIKTTPSTQNASPVARRLATEHNIDLASVVGSGARGQITKEDVEAAIASPARTTAATPAGKVRAAPAARRLARELGIDIAQVQGTGPRGQVTKDDVSSFPTAKQPVGPAIKETIPLTGIRRRIAERMTVSFQTTPHISVSLQADMSNLEALRSKMNETGGGEEIPHVSLTALVTKAVAMVLKRHPWLNSTFAGDKIHVYDEINIGVAVAIDEGLIVPVVRGADHKDIYQIATDISDMATRAREGALKLSDVTEGTFTISNLGPFGIEQFTAIVNPPNAAILALGTIRMSVLADRQGKIVVRPMVWMTLSADHRIVDGAVAAKFLTDLRDSIEDITSIIQI